LFGKPIITTTHGGYTIHLANNDDFYSHITDFEKTTPWDSLEFDRRNKKPSLIDEINAAIDGAEWVVEISTDRRHYERAMQTIKARPVMFAYSCLYRVAQFWSPLPNKLTADESWKRALLRYATCAWYLGVYAAAMAGVWRQRGKLLRSPWIWSVLLCLVFTGVHTFYWSNLRMRAPLMPFVAIVAAVGAAYVFERVRGISSQRPRTAQYTKSH
jgi:hypothetical protein